MASTADTDDLSVGSGDLDDGRDILGGVGRHDDVGVDVAAEAVVNDPPFGIAVCTFGKNSACDGTLQESH